MKRTGVILAAALLLATDAVVLLKAARNRFGEPRESIELTERELALVRPQRDSTALFLKLEYGNVWRFPKYEDGPGWFDQGKLEELGFDCSFPLTDEAAARHYGVHPAREAFIVLELDEARENGSRLHPVDAGLRATALRTKHADPARYLIVPALVSVHYVPKPYVAGVIDMREPYLQGLIQMLRVEEVAVPPAALRMLLELPPAVPVGPPRYAAVLKYGQNYEPWIESVRILP
jgi:hypothetical protein